jgi:lipoyl(octanoyl) transferase
VETVCAMKAEWLAVDLPCIAYHQAQALQEQFVAAKHAGRLPYDLMLLLEHPPVFTLGRNGGRENLMVSDAFLKKAGVSVRPSDRGGNITYHGPGQIVGYPVLDLQRARMGVADYVAALEDVMIAVSLEWGVAAQRDPRNRGAWVKGAKVGSIGLCLRHGMTFHGFALNVNNDLTPFEWINPCGLAGVRMTSLAQVTGHDIPMNRLRQSVWRQVSEIFGVTLHPSSLDELPGHAGSDTAFEKED